MNRLRDKIHLPKTADSLAAAGTILRAVRDTTDVFPPLKSAAATVLTLIEMSQKVKSNRDDCRHLARRASETFHDIYRQTKDYNELPSEVQSSINQIEQIFHDILAFMKHLENQNFIRRYSRLDDNKSRITNYNKRLDEAIVHFGVNLQLSVHRLHTETSSIVKSTLLELDDVSRARHGQILDVSQMSAKERELLARLLGYARFGAISIAFFF